MNLATILVLLAVAGLVVLALVFAFKQSKRGGPCASCGSECPHSGQCAHLHNRTL